MNLTTAVSLFLVSSVVALQLILRRQSTGRLALFKPDRRLRRTRIFNNEIKDKTGLTKEEIDELSDSKHS